MPATTKAPIAWRPEANLLRDDGQAPPSLRLLMLIRRSALIPELVELVESKSVDACELLDEVLAVGF